VDVKSLCSDDLHELDPRLGTIVQQLQRTIGGPPIAILLRFECNPFVTVSGRDSRFFDIEGFLSLFDPANWPLQPDVTTLRSLLTIARLHFCISKIGTKVLHAKGRFDQVFEARSNKPTEHVNVSFRCDLVDGVVKHQR